jgi:hypothetical protein
VITRASDGFSGSTAQPGSDVHLLAAFDTFGDENSTESTDISVTDADSPVNDIPAIRDSAASASSLLVRNETGLLLHVVLLDVAAASVQAYVNNLDVSNPDDAPQSPKVGVEHLGSWLVETGHCCVPHSSFSPPDTSFGATGHSRDTRKAVCGSVGTDSDSNLYTCTSPQALEKMELDFDGQGTAFIRGWNPGGGVILSTSETPLEIENPAEHQTQGDNDGRGAEVIAEPIPATLSPRLLWIWGKSKHSGIDGSPGTCRELRALSPLQLENYSQYDLIVAGCRPEWPTMRILGRLSARERGGHTRGAWDNGSTTLHVPATIASCTHLYVVRAGILRPPCSLPPNETIW